MVLLWRNTCCCYRFTCFWVDSWLVVCFNVLMMLLVLFDCFEYLFDFIMFWLLVILFSWDDVLCWLLNTVLFLGLYLVFVVILMWLFITIVVWLYLLFVIVCWLLVVCAWMEFEFCCICHRHWLFYLCFGWDVGLRVCYIGNSVGGAGISIWSNYFVYLNLGILFVEGGCLSVVIVSLCIC